MKMKPSFFFMRGFLHLLMYFFVSSIWGQNLLTNPDAESPLVGGEIDGWTEVVGGNWTVRTSNPVAQSGTNYFFPGVGSAGELIQDVDVSAYATTIDAGTQQFGFQGYLRVFPQSPADDARIVVEYRDATNTTVLYSYDTGNFSNTSSWDLVSDVATAPNFTRIIRVRLISSRNNGANNDGYYDNLSLTATSVLPIKVLDFAGVQNGKHVELSWTVGKDGSELGYTIERSPNGLEWQELTFVKAEDGQEGLYQYHSLDPSPTRTQNFYRLKQVSVEGTHSYSGVIQVAFDPETLLNLFPNPTTGLIQFEGIREASISLMDSQGRILLETVYEGKPLDISALPTGVYVVKVSTPQHHWTRKVYVE